MMKLPVRSMRAPLVIMAIIVALLLAWPWLVKSYYFVTAPKFSVIQYTGTVAHYGCLALITDDSCWTNYYYKGTGTEAEIAKGLTAELAKRGYSLGPDFANYRIDCNTSVRDQQGHPQEADQYSYEKIVRGYNQPAELYAFFYHAGSSLHDGLDPDKWAVGCSSKYATYEVEINLNRAQKN